jgi:hypothetical protein
MAFGKKETAINTRRHDVALALRQMGQLGI